MRAGRRNVSPRGWRSFSAVLSGCRVLELCDESGVLAGRILAALGADVVKVEPPGGDPFAQREISEGGPEDSARRLAWYDANAGKRGITLDCERPAGRAVLARLLERADVLLETLGPVTLERWSLAPEALHQRYPRLVHCAITPFGQTGPYARQRGGELVCAAMAGAMKPDHGVAAPAGARLRPDTYELAAPEAVLGVVLALFGREASGRGQLVDVSLHECRRNAHAHGGGRNAREGPGVGRSGAGRAPRVDEHNRDVLREAGFSDVEISRFVEEGVI